MMTPIAITARFPLGVYHGHAPDGGVDFYPSPARLFTALVSAAYTGPEMGSDGALIPDVIHCLNWLEEHPPTGLKLPEAMEVDSEARGRVAYRDTGVIEKNAPKRSSKRVSDGVAVRGPMQWIWDDMPAEVRTVLDRLCADVPCLGETDSPVVMEVGEAVDAKAPNWRLNPDATPFTRGGRQFVGAAPGRADALARLYAEARPQKPPTKSADRFKPSADEVRLQPVSTECLRMLQYVEAEPERATVSGPPWNEVVVLLADDGSGGEIEPSRRLDWCVAFHRALISRIGDGAPAVVTGRYLDGAPPANRLAIQYAPASVLALSTLEGSTTSAPGVFLVLLPRGIKADETAVVLAALTGMTRLKSRWGVAKLRPLDEVVSAGDFWKAPGPGTSRMWSPAPVAVPEVVRQRRDWRFEDAILLSLGFVRREALKSVPKGERGYRSLVSQVRDHHAGVLGYQRITDRPAAYAHKMPQGMMAQPYRAVIDVGDLLADRTLAAIGQSRHLGGGLLVPVDLPLELAQAAVRRGSHAGD
ncbi:type I-G CRISPR-associated protein Csb2 [Actinomyces glycerinitolerans]|nr:type I-U CRISPR-associated protein Csb2 [Actinomyces glycerinitolerans]